MVLVAGTVRVAPASTVTSPVTELFPTMTVPAVALRVAWFFSVLSSGSMNLTVAPVTVSPLAEVTFSPATLTAAMLASPTVTVPVNHPLSAVEASSRTASLARVRELRVTLASVPMTMVVQSSVAVKAMSPSATVPLMVMSPKIVGRTSAETALATVVT